MTVSSALQIDYARRHLRFGWWSLLVFATLGLLLETLHTCIGQQSIPNFGGHLLQCALTGP